MIKSIKASRITAFNFCKIIKEEFLQLWAQPVVAGDSGKLPGFSYSNDGASRVGFRVFHEIKILSFLNGCLRL